MWRGHTLFLGRGRGVRALAGTAGAAREAALEVLRRVDAGGAYASLALGEVLRRRALDPRDRALATELAYGVIRRRQTLDWYLEQVSTRPLAHMTPQVRNILRMAVYEYLYLDRIPEWATTHAAVELARRHGHEGVARFVSGVLRGLLRRLPELRLPDAAADPVQHLALLTSQPRWLVERWLARYGFDEAQALLEALGQTPPLTVRVNRLRTDRDALRQRLAREGVEAHPTRWSPDGLVLSGVASTGSLKELASFREGLFSVQDESSMLVAPVVDPRPGDLVLDVAAAPGGKAAHLAERMGDRGRVLAIDLHPQRLELVEENARRLGLRSIETVCADARSVGRLFAGRADAVLCDLPCSGLGTLHRRPDARWRKQEADIPALATLQDEILESAWGALRPGGVLVYSTCTITPEENEERVEALVRRHPDLVPEDLTPYLPAGLAGEPGVREGRIQLLPHRHGTDGFFIARLRRRSG
ncbi:ribosomal RNA small subunit methyltransferase B [Caldinitratiruptor microaerophilus]|uniref:16S rRNA (cytosine(967)-C(5))-methyltransferase n=1 Tax=Caldinitratiruptor microaerophilus TaxID=671077 RepID=A0AA35CNP1_9FIRM|nr:ribosomal RNA small subunit methyltransferase B [Caldinitratiruptor microaerophilus]